MLETLFARPRVLVGCCVLVAFGVLASHPTWAYSIGADVWNVPALNEQVRESAAEDDRLTGEGEDVLHRIAIKDSIIANLIAGRSTLADATDRFTELNAGRPHYRDAIRGAYPGATDREKFARNVIAFALARVAAHERTDLSSRLEAELRQMLAAGASH